MLCCTVSKSTHTVTAPPAEACSSFGLQKRSPFSSTQLLPPLASYNNTFSGCDIGISSWHTVQKSKSSGAAVLAGKLWVVCASGPQASGRKLYMSRTLCSCGCASIRLGCKLASSKAMMMLLLASGQACNGAQLGQHKDASVDSLDIGKEEYVWQTESEPRSG